MNFLVDNAPLYALSGGRQLTRTIILATAIILLAIIATATTFWWRSRPHPAKVVVNSFYENLNRGILGDPAGFAAAFDQLIPEFQDSIRKMFPGEYPKRFGELYEGARVHSVQNVSLIEERSDTQRTYSVAISVRETHPENMFARLISTRSGKLAKDFWKEYGSYDAVSEAVLANVSEYYESHAPNSSSEHNIELRQQVMEQLKLHELFDPRLIRQLAEQHALPRKDTGPAHPEHGFMHFTTVEVSKITVVYHDGRWRIRTIAPQAKVFNVTNIR